VPGIKFPGRSTDGIIETIDIYPTLAKLCGLTPPASINGTSFIPMLNNPDAPGKGWAYSREIDSLNQDTVRTDRWRLIRVSSSYDLYDFQAYPYEVDDVSAANPAVVSDLVSNKLNVQATRAGTTNFAGWRAANFTSSEATNTAISGLQADPDGDGLANIFECLSATNPKTNSSANPLIGEVRDLSAYGLPTQVFTARFTASSLVDDLAFSVNSFSDVTGGVVQPMNFVTNSALGGGLYEYLFSETNSLSARPHGFVKLTAQQTP